MKLYVNKTEICKFQATDNVSCYNFCLGSVSKGFTEGKSLNGHIYDFSVDHSSIKKRRHS